MNIVLLISLGAVLVTVLTSQRNAWWVGAVGVGAAYASGALRGSEAYASVKSIAPVLWFLVSMLIVGGCCERYGLFKALAGKLGRLKRGVFPLSFLSLALVSTLLNLDTAVVLFLPLLLRESLDEKMVYMSGHVPNSASLLLPISNLTSLLAWKASGLSFVGFARLMALPWLGILIVEYVLTLGVFGTHKVKPSGHKTEKLVVYPVVVLLGMLVLFMLCSVLGFEPALAASGAAVLLLVPLVWSKKVSTKDIKWVNLRLIALVLVLTILSNAVAKAYLGGVGSHLPSSNGFTSLLLVAVLAALLSNVLNNLPATLVMLPLLHSSGLILAMLIGVGVGPNLTYVGSLANLIWRSQVGDHVKLLKFTVYGLVTTLPCLAVGVALLYAVYP